MWNLITSPERVAAHRARLTERCAAIGRDVGEIEITALDAEDLRAEEIAGYSWTPAFERARLRSWRDSGIEHVIVNMSDAHDVSKLRTYGREVIAQLP